MKNKYFVILVIILCLVVSYAIYEFWFGNPENFLDPEIRHEPKPGNTYGTVYTGGPIVAVLLSLVFMVVTFVTERFISLWRARGRGPIEKFVKQVHDHVQSNNIDAAIDECNKQRGSAASILRSGLEQYQLVKDKPDLNGEQRLGEVKRAIDEATGLETPLLERNLIVLSTIASIATMLGLLGTTVGMIRAFQALATSGQAASAVQLSIGISEALINTAGGLIGAVLAIIFYNIFTNKVDNFLYMIEESTLSLMETLAVRVK
ncbi:MAG: MotA/TolQ/ExbB proton channel family protein [Chlorobi bacterium]|nr:MotA/TolQ/ExbB proton channel family protein [Chlorobiota bacterium]